jgi:K+-sensing histidine kinase KdpD
MEQIVIVILVVLLGVVSLLLWQKNTDVRRSQRAERIKQTFLQSIEHEVRAPLETIRQLAKTVAQEDLYLSKNEKRNISDQMVYSANLIGTLMDEVMMFTDNTQQGHALKIESFSPNALCRRCLEGNMQNIFHREGVKLVFARKLSDEFFVKSDRHLVELIVNKLIINACRFTESGEVVVGCHTEGRPDCLTIYVKDTGAGIPENRTGNLFTYFEEPDDMKDEAELDLSVCRRLAEKLGGDLIYDDSYQERTMMLLVLPLR